MARQARPATTPARDAKHLRAIAAAVRDLKTANGRLVQALADARAAGDSETAIAAMIGADGGRS